MAEINTIHLECFDNETGKKVIDWLDFADHPHRRSKGQTLIEREQPWVVVGEIAWDPPNVRLWVRRKKDGES